MKRIIYSIIITILSFNTIRVSAQNWTGLNNGVTFNPSSASVKSLYEDTIANLLYVGGSFRFAGGIPASGIASWNGTNWDSLGRGLDNYPSNGSNSGWPNSMCRYNNELYISGGFVHVGTTSAHWIARWDGIAWHTLTTEPHNGGGMSMIVYNNELYLGGIFDSVGNLLTNGLAKWNGSIWSDVHNFPNYNAWLSSINQVNCLTEFQGNLYVAGNFEGLNGYKEIVYWDGSQWSTWFKCLCKLYGCLSKPIVCCRSFRCCCW